MKIKALMLALLVVFAVASAFLVFKTSSYQITTENVAFPKAYSVVQADGEKGFEPNGDPIDTPAMPG